MYDSLIFTNVLSRYENTLFNELSINLVYQLNIFLDDNSYIIPKTNIKQHLDKHIKGLLKELTTRHRFDVTESIIPIISFRLKAVIDTYLEYEKLMVNNVLFNKDTLGYKLGIDYSLQLVTEHNYKFKENIRHFRVFHNENLPTIYLLNACHTTPELYDFYKKLVTISEIDTYDLV